MKIIKKIAAIMLSVMMVLGMCSVVGAEGAGTSETGTITIDNAIVGQDYTIYKILTLESYVSVKDAGGNETGLYSYKPATGWDKFFKAPGEGSKYVDINENGYVTWKAGAEAVKLAQAALKYATDEANKSAFNTNDIHGVHAEGTTVTIDNLPLGYYLVDSSAGALCSLDTTNPNATIKEKNGVPSVDKVVKSGDDYKENNTASIGDKVEFKTTITAQPGAQNYVLHDKMDAGLTFDDTSIKINLMKSGETTESPVGNTNYTVKTIDLESTNPCTFHIEFKQDFCDTLKANDQIIITYSATLNEKAEIGNTGNKNETKLTYGDNNKTETATTTTRTFEIPVFKYTLKDNKKTALKDATFTLSKDSVTTPNTKEIIKLEKKNGTTTEEYLVNSSGTVTKITTGDTGKFTIQGLDAGIYYLTETQQPAGYNKLKDPLKIVIGENGTITVDDKSITGTDVKVLNQTGSILPSTGGMGTTLFYIFGAILVIGSGVVLITKKRMK